MTSCTEALSLRDSSFPRVRLQATVVLSIMDAFMRRPSHDARVIGALLGESGKDGSITISEYFSVPFAEEEKGVVIEQHHFKQMHTLHKRNNKKESLVGWFATPTAKGELINDNSSLLHDFFESQTSHPVHIVVNTLFVNGKLQVRGFVRKEIKIQEQVLAQAFQEVKVSVVFNDGEAKVLSLMNKAVSQLSTASTELKAPVLAPSDRLAVSIQTVQQAVQLLQQYVDGVVEGKIEGKREIGVQIAQALHAFTCQPLSAEQLSNLQTRYQDLLMVAYLSTLTQTQTFVAQKLNQIL